MIPAPEIGQNELGASPTNIERALTIEIKNQLLIENFLLFINK